MGIAGGSRGRYPRFARGGRGGIECVEGRALSDSSKPVSALAPVAVEYARAANPARAEHFAGRYVTFAAIGILCGCVFVFLDGTSAIAIAFAAATTPDAEIP